MSSDAVILIAVLALVALVAVAVAVVAWAGLARERRSAPLAGPEHRELRADLDRLGRMVQRLAQTNAEQFGRVDHSMQVQAQAAASLAESTRTLREALANPKARGQWGERMAEDVLRLAGFVEHVNYEKQTHLEGGRGIPDYTFPLPKGHVLYMDVKFPLNGYLRALEAGSSTERDQLLQAFVRDVRQRVKELAARDYARSGERRAVDYVLLFVPNESLAGVIHELAPGLIDEALAQRVVLCSPLTLYAFLSVVRQAYDALLVEQTSDELLALLGQFGQQWARYTDSLDKVAARFDAVHRELEQLTGTRRRQLERPLAALDSLRRERGIEPAGSVVALVPDDRTEAGA
jgi:DNA recombination protein RmuC